MSSEPLLSAIVVVGKCRKRCQRVATALCTQTASAAIEVIIVDLAPSGTPRLDTPSEARVIYFSMPESTPWSRARCEAIRRASAPVVAFTEDHCFPSATWAEHLIEAHKGPWAAVGYAFTNANPETYISRGSLVNDYGFWMHPARGGATTFLPGSNASYKREVLLSFGEQLEFLLTPDFNLQEILLQRGLLMAIEANALTAHQNFTSLWGLMQANQAFARLMAGRRKQAQGWNRARSILYGLVTPATAPALISLRLFLNLKGRESLIPVILAGLPIFLITHLWAAYGEALGYLFGEGEAEATLCYWELSTEREPTS